jgi:4-hydroxy-tetrahydrodipicolinate synthase
VVRFFAVRNIVGLKDTTGDIGRGIMLLRDLPAHFAVHSGDDPTASALMLHGARGNISVTANVIPSLMSRLCAAARTGDVQTVRAISRHVAPLHEAMFIEANPIPVKWALAQPGKLRAYYQLPMVPLSEPNHARVAEALRDALEGLAGAEEPDYAM